MNRYENTPPILKELVSPATRLGRPALVDLGPPLHAALRWVFDDQYGRLVGVISQSDVVRAVATAKEVTVA